MKRWHWLARGVALAAAVMIVGWWSGASWAERQLQYPRPCPNCCIPNVRGWGHFPTHWREWPDDEKLPERINPGGVGKEVIPTPEGQKEVTLPKAATPTPVTPAPAKSEPEPLPPGGIVPPEGLLLPGNQPGQPPPGGEGPSMPAPGEGLPGLPPEPDVTRPPPPRPAEQPQPSAEPPAKQPATPPDVPKPREKATTTPSVPSPQPGAWRENRQPAVVAAPSAGQVGNLPDETATPPAARPTWPGSVVSPVGRLEPERNAALPGAYRADSIASAPPDWQTDRVEPAAYATAEPPARPDDVAVPPVALGGYCPVELVSNGRWVPGDLRWTVVHKGCIYRLSGARQREQFLAHPDAFAPVNSGSDPVLRVDQNRTVAGQPAYCATYDGRLYMFSSADTQARFNSNPQRYAAGK